MHGAVRCRYGNPKTDGRFLHWNHAILPHWNPELAKQWPSGTQFKPPASLHSPFYPARGPYSSSDVDTIRVRPGTKVCPSVPFSSVYSAMRCPP
jgi:hypothetical protein